MRHVFVSRLIPHQRLIALNDFEILHRREGPEIYFLRAESAVTSCSFLDLRSGDLKLQGAVVTGAAIDLELPVDISSALANMAPDGLV